MRSTRSRLWTTRTSWTIAGAVFGAAFPLASWMVIAATEGGVGLRDIHNAHPLMWVVDLAPVVLAGAGTVIGDLIARLAVAEEQQRLLSSRLAHAWRADMTDRQREVERLADSGFRRASEVSHELRTPLTAILGFLAIVEDEMGDGDDTAHGCIQEVRSACEFMLELINDFLDTSRSLVSMLDVRCEPSDVGEIAGRAIRQLSPLAMERSLDLVDLGPPGVFAIADPKRLQQAISNLVVNSIRYTESGMVTVSTTAVDDEAIIEVTDTGVGMTEEELQRLFEPFERGVERTDKGTGLGLGLARSMVEAMGGTLEAVSPGRNLGTTMTIRLPLVHQAVAASAA